MLLFILLFCVVNFCFFLSFIFHCVFDFVYICAFCAFGSVCGSIYVLCFFSCLNVYVYVMFVFVCELAFTF